jgi:hypothetical protein
MFVAVGKVKVLNERHGDGFLIASLMSWREPTMRVALVAVGINRSLSHTWPSIDREVAGPIGRSNWIEMCCSITLVVPRGGRVDNPRTQESGFVECELPEGLSGWHRNVIREETLRPEGLAHAVGGLKAPGWDYDSKTVANLFTYLRALESAYENIFACRRPDAIILLRPDLLIGDGLAIVRLLRLFSITSLIFKDLAFLPRWQHWGGLNDRFAILSPPAAKKYFRRIRVLEQFALSASEKNSERLLAFALRGTTVFKVIRTPMFRVRLGGKLEATDLDYFRTSA